MEEIEINDDFKRTLDIMEKTNKSLFITGKAGTGKSTLLKYFVEKTDKNVVVVAPTGIAALNIGGQTIHSFFRLPPKMLDHSDVKKTFNGIYKRIDTIIIDEISMVRADMFDAIDIFMRLNGREPNKPFGGVQIILFGDLYQLPPVVENEVEAFMKHIYESPYFFSAKIMKHFKFNIINLTKVYRQKDSYFVEFLDKVRLGEADETTLELINSKVKPTPLGDDFVTLTPTNNVANFINQEKLEELPDKLFVYKAKKEGEFNLSLNNLPVDLEINLKKGAKVIFVKNDPKGRWVNGSLGRVEELGDNFVKIKLDENSSIVDVTCLDWEKRTYEYNPNQRRIISKVIGKLTQIPLKLAWALTIHKCQGQTLDKVHINITSGVWEFGHVYVALSRCRTLEGISLESKIWLNDIKVDTRVTEFLKNKSNETESVEETILDKKETELMGIVRKDIYRKRNPESSYKECFFHLESGESIICIWFIPTILAGWKVKILGGWNESGESFYAESVERVIEKPKFNQLKLDSFKT